MSDKPKSQVEAPPPSDDEAEGERAPAPDSADDIPVEVEAEADEGAADDAEGGDDDNETPEARAARLEREKKETWDRLLRATADLENLRKRSKREVSEARVAARTDVLKEMLPIIDNLERAIDHAAEVAENGSDGGILDGVRLVLRQFEQALERCGVKPIEAAGNPFDPNLHDAMGQLETSEHAPGTVAQVYQKGYTIGERLLRPAMVVVAKAPPDPDADAGGKPNGAARGDDSADGAAGGDDGDAGDSGDGGGEETL